MLYYSLLLLITTIHDFLSFSIVVRKREEWKHCYGRPRATVNIAMPLQQSMRWDITLLVQSVNLICAKKSMALLSLNIFFLCVNSRITCNIF